MYAFESRMTSNSTLKFLIDGIIIFLLQNPYYNEIVNDYIVFNI